MKLYTDKGFMLVNKYHKVETVQSFVAGFDEIVWDNDTFYFRKHRNFTPSLQSGVFTNYKEAVKAYEAEAISWV